MMVPPACSSRAHVLALHCYIYFLSLKSCIFPSEIIQKAYIKVPVDRCKAKKQLKLEEIKIEAGKLSEQSYQQQIYAEFCQLGLLCLLGQTVAQTEFIENSKVSC